MGHDKKQRVGASAVDETTGVHKWIVLKSDGQAARPARHTWRITKVKRQGELHDDLDEQVTRGKARAIVRAELEKLEPGQLARLKRALDERPRRLVKGHGGDSADELGRLTARDLGGGRAGIEFEQRDGSTSSVGFGSDPLGRDVEKHHRPSFADILDQPETKLGDPDY
jgi:hypothetical protein